MFFKKKKLKETFEKAYSFTNTLKYDFDEVSM